MKLRGIALGAALIAVPLAVNAESTIIGSVSTSNPTVYVSGITGRLRVEENAPQIIVSGDKLTTPGESAWGLVRIDRVGLVEVGAQSSVGFDTVSDLVHLDLASGALRYTLEAGQSLAIEADGTLFVAGRKESGVIPASAGTGASGTIAIDNGQVVVHNAEGSLRAVPVEGAPLDVPQGQLLAFNAGASGGSLTGFQVGGPPSSSSSSGGYRRCRTAGGTRWRCLGPWQKAGVIFVGVVAGYFIYEEIDDDDRRAEPPGSPS